MAGVATIVAFHAHPDDEVLLTGGTLARLAAGGCCSGASGTPSPAHRPAPPGEISLGATG
jgi:hypothetical protein